MPIRTSLVALLALATLALYACGTPPQAEQPPGVGVSDAREAPPAAVPAPTWSAATPVGEIVAEAPASARLFELLGIDYCCGGEKTLGEVAATGGHDVGELIGTLRAMGPAKTGGATRAWADAPLEEVMAHIVGTHHAYLRRELPRLETVVATVVRVHGDSHAELAEVGELFLGLQEEIEPHLRMEEEQLFPAILERKPGAKALLDRMRTDHDGVGAALHRIRELTSDFEVPKDACVLYKQMLTGLEALERDLHVHVHLENNVFLPRARAALRDT
jgi:regulator of cell morphogenesis and NO signaling